jgi:hypothetical protein
MLNRPDRPLAATPASDGTARGGTFPGGPPRSRGLLALETARAVEAEPAGALGLARAALDHALAQAGRARHRPFSLAFLSPDGCWVMSAGGDGGPPGVETLSPGWHALTHADLDAPDEPRTAWLLRDLSGWRPASPEEAERGLLERLAAHEAPATGVDRGHPAVCIHRGRMVTVSSSIVCLTRDAARYLHVEGRPCEDSPLDCSALLAGDLAAVERP